MQNDRERPEAKLNSKQREERLSSLKRLKDMIENGMLPRPEVKGFINNHIHTWYSFSPYSPTKAVWKSYQAGLETAGIVDHDNAAGAVEFIEAGNITGLATTVGMECRVDFSATPLAGRRLNHPDQLSTAYIALHGIPHDKIEATNTFFREGIEKRVERTEKMTERLNRYLRPWEIELSFNRDVLPLSMYGEGGTVTERHLLFALAEKLTGKFGKGEGLINFLRKKLKINISTKLLTLLKELDNPYYTYDLMGILKSQFLELIYIPATEECYDVSSVVNFANSINSIPAYAYLGDITESVTGDKKAQAFEDSYLEELFKTIKELGFKAVTYMPSRNSLEQINRVSKLSVRYGLLQICGEDINSPRQSFTGKAITREKYPLLVDTTWALIGHEILATDNPEDAFFSEKTAEKYPDLYERIKVYSEIGRKRRQI